MELERFKRFLLTKGYSLSTITSYTNGVKQYLEFTETGAIREALYEYDEVTFTNHAIERLEERLSINEEAFRNLLENTKHDYVHDGYEAEKDQHIFKVEIKGFNTKFIGAIDSYRKLVIITIL